MANAQPQEDRWRALLFAALVVASTYLALGIKELLGGTETYTGVSWLLAGAGWLAVGLFGPPLYRWVVAPRAGVDGESAMGARPGRLSVLTIVSTLYVAAVIVFAVLGAIQLPAEDERWRAEIDSLEVEMEQLRAENARLKAERHTNAPDAQPPP